ncbi:MAG: elongation factor Ts [Planctomycetes bacterium]|nr:elongation factor Ts [Planctomycetota bacterium]MBL7106580.1 elongation factor Ts [Phycisphaerae bacterium]
MADISASAVMKLRKMSSQGMMDCKKALAEANGDVEKAMGILRKKGLATLEKRSARETSEGLVVGRIAEDGKSATLVSLCCETDFVAKNDDFVEVADTLLKYAEVCSSDKGVENLLETEVDGKKFSEIITDLVSKTGEKTEIGDFARFSLNGSGLISIYVHFNKKVGAMVKVETSDDSVAGSEQVVGIANDVAMHITATMPLALNKDSIDPKTIEKERAIYADQVKGKPENIIEKIVDGKLNKFFAENCLLNQPFVKDDSMTVEQVVAQAAKSAGGTAKITDFIRISVGS